MNSPDNAATPQAGAVLFTINLMSLAKFYERVLGMHIRKTDHDHVALENGSFRLVVHQIPEPYAKNISISIPPTIRSQSAIKLSFLVDSISDARKTAAALGGVIYGPDKEWQYMESTFCDGYDPDGNVFQLFEKLTQS